MSQPHIQSWQHWVGNLCVLASLLTPPLLPQPVQAQLNRLCATPGRDGDGVTLTNIVNTYYPISASGTVGVGGTQINLGSAVGGASVNAIQAGDLLLVIQMQDAQINSTNTLSYGDNVSGSPAAGSQDLVNTGRYEYVIATNNVSTGGGILTLRGAGPNNGLINSYTNSDASSSQGQRRYQVVRVPQYNNATLSSSLSALPWNGQVGGVLAIDVARELNLGGATVNLSGLGFRGGGARQSFGGSGSSNDVVTLSSNLTNGSKGEGIAGTPRFVFNGTTVIDNTTEGYPGGSFARGAPGNAGGGGTDGNPAANDENTGGGGGGNGGSGGRGGFSWNSILNSGGFGGVSFPAAINRLVLGGGGGAGTRNNSAGNESSGGVGGGMALFRVGRVTGSGSILANGTQGPTPANDAGGGGGAGGSILFTAVTPSTVGAALGSRVSLTGLSVQAIGARGTNAWPQNGPGTTDQLQTGGNNARHGPGGGGGGGVIFLSNPAGILSDVRGGANGTSTTAASPFGALEGVNGISGTVDPVTAPGALPGSLCPPNLRLVKRITLVNGTTINNVMDSPNNPEDNLPFWPSNYLTGGGLSDVGAPTDPVDTMVLGPGNEVEYTIYFLSDGFRNTSNTFVCDRIPTHQTFVANAYNTIPQATGGLSGSDRGVVIAYSGFSGSPQSYTSANDGDRVRFMSPGDVSQPFPGSPTFAALCGSATNPTGAVVVNLGSIPRASAQGTPNSFGLIRFRARVN